jgi:hypothetical protein
MSGARTSSAGNHRLIDRSKPLFSVPIFYRNVCERETASRWKYLTGLIQPKVGESPTRGDAGKLHNACWRGWQAKLRKYQHRGHWQAPRGLGGAEDERGRARKSKASPDSLNL